MSITTNNTDDNVALINSLQEQIANNNHGQDLNDLFEQVARSLLHRVNAEVKSNIAYLSWISEKFLLYVYVDLLLLFELFIEWETNREQEIAVQSLKLVYSM